MKKYGYLLIAAALVLSACGKAPASTERTETPSTSAAAVEPEETEADVPVPIDVEISAEYLSEWQDMKEIMGGRSPKIQVLSDGYQDLQEGMDFYCEERLKYITEVYETWLRAAKEEYEFDKTGFLGYHVASVAVLKRSDSRIVSFADVESSYFGGAHPNYYAAGVNFDPTNGKRLTLGDVVTDREKVFEYVVRYLEEHSETNMLFPEYRETLKNAFQDTGGTSPQWIMDSEGLKVLFSPYEIAPYAAGSIEVPVPYGDELGLIREEYVPGVKGLAKQIPVETLHKIDLSGDGSEEELFLAARELEEEYCSQITVTVSKKSLEYRLPGFFFEAYFIGTGDGRAYLYVESKGENDYRMMEVFDLNGESPAHVGTVNDTFQDHLIFDPENFSLYTRLDALGTFFGYRRYRVGGDGIPVTDETVYRIVNPKHGWDHVLTASKTIPVWIHEEEGDSRENLKMERQELPMGTKFRPRKTDGQSFVEMELEDGRLCDIRFELRDFVRYIEGESEWDYFENLPYAG